MLLAGIEVKLSDLEALVQLGYSFVLDETLTPLRLSRRVAGDAVRGYVVEVEPRPFGNWEAHVKMCTRSYMSFVGISGWVSDKPLQAVICAEAEAARMWDVWGNTKAQDKHNGGTYEQKDKS